MLYSNQQITKPLRWAPWSRFIIGVFCFIGAIFFFTRGVTPPGIFGEVIRHNQTAAIDATPLVPYDVENIVEIQAGLAEWWNNPDTTQSSSNLSKVE